jgi:hypothetical protein
MPLITLSISNVQERREENIHEMCLWMTLMSVSSEIQFTICIFRKMSAKNTKAATQYKTENTFLL